MENLTAGALVTPAPGQAGQPCVPTEIYLSSMCNFPHDSGMRREVPAVWNKTDLIRENFVSPDDFSSRQDDFLSRQDDILSHQWDFFLVLTIL